MCVDVRFDHGGRFARSAVSHRAPFTTLAFVRCPRPGSVSCFACHGSSRSRRRAQRSSEGWGLWYSCAVWLGLWDVDRECEKVRRSFLSSCSFPSVCHKKYRTTAVFHMQQGDKCLPPPHCCCDTSARFAHGTLALAFVDSPARAGILMGGSAMW